MIYFIADTVDLFLTRAHFGLCFPFMKIHLLSLYVYALVTRQSVIISSKYRYIVQNAYIPIKSKRSVYFV